MPSATFQIFDSFPGRLGDGTIDLDSHSFKAFITNSTPNLSDSIKAQIAEITPGSGYTAGGVALAGVTWTMIAGSPQGQWLFDCNNFAWNASGGNIGPGRSVVIYDENAVYNDLVGFWDYGSNFTITDGNSLTVTTANGVLVADVAA